MWQVYEITLESKYSTLQALIIIIAWVTCVFVSTFEILPWTLKLWSVAAAQGPDFIFGKIKKWQQNPSMTSTLMSVKNKSVMLESQFWPSAPNVLEYLLTKVLAFTCYMHITVKCLLCAWQQQFKCHLVCNTLVFQMETPSAVIVSLLPLPTVFYLQQL